MISGINTVSCSQGGSPRLVNISSRLQQTTQGLHWETPLAGKRGNEIILPAASVWRNNAGSDGCLPLWCP